MDLALGVDNVKERKMKCPIPVHEIALTLISVQGRLIGET